MLNQKVILLLVAIAAVCCTSADNTDQDILLTQAADNTDQSVLLIKVADNTEQGVLLTQTVDNIIALNLKSTEKCVRAIGEYHIKVYTEFHESMEVCDNTSIQCYNEVNADSWKCYVNWNSCQEPFEAIRYQKIQQLQDIINGKFPQFELAKSQYAWNAEYCLNDLKTCFNTVNINCYGVYQGCTDFSASHYVQTINGISNMMVDAINALSK